jgi:hypothetical protein
MNRKYKPGAHVLIAEAGERYTATVLDADVGDGDYLVSDDWGRGWELEIEGRDSTAVAPGLSIKGRIVAESDIIGPAAQVQS